MFRMPLFCVEYDVNKMKKLLPLFFVSSLFAQDNPYDTIVKRNAFTLLNEAPIKIELPKIVIKPPVQLYLTGIMNYRGKTNVYLFSKDIDKRFLTLNTNKRTDSGVTLLSVEKGLVEVNNNGVIEMLSFESHKLPNVLSPLPKGSPTVIKKDSKNNKDKNKNIAPPTPRPSIVKVPSRRPKIDPKVIQKGLEYIDRIDDKEKREYILKRLEGLQSGQNNLDRKIDTNERRRQYDERRRGK